MSLFNVNISIINRFCENFKDNFSNTQFRAFTMLPYAMLKDYKRLNLSCLAKELPINYQTLQYFVSESHWDYASLNAARINLLRKQRTTGFSKNGVLAIDDTGSIKPYAKKTEGVSYQYCPPLKNEAYCNVAVVGCYANPVKHVPLNLKPSALWINGRLKTINPAISLSAITHLLRPKKLAPYISCAGALNGLSRNLRIISISTITNYGTKKKLCVTGYSASLSGRLFIG